MLQEAGVMAVESLLRYSNARVGYVVRGTDIIRHVTTAMLRHPGNTTIQRSGSWSLIHVIHDPPCIQDVFTHRGVVAMLRTLSRHRADASTQDACLRALDQIAKRTGVMVLERHEPTGILPLAVAHAMVSHTRDPAVVHSGSMLLESIAPRTAASIRQLGGIDALMPPLTWHLHKEVTYYIEPDGEHQPHFNFATWAARLATTDDVMCWDPGYYAQSLLDTKGYKILTDGRCTKEQVTELTRILLDICAERDEYTYSEVRALLAIIGTMTWHAAEYAQAFLDEPDFVSTTRALLEVEDATTRRCACRALGCIARWKL